MKMPEGKRFSHTYLARGEPIADSPRARRRMSGLIYELEDLDSNFGAYVGKELGISVTYGTYGYDWHKFIGACQLQDLLDIVTVGFAYLEEKKSKGIKNFRSPGIWLSEISRIFSEENLRYKVDQKGGIHFSIDEEFERVRAASIAALQNPRYGNVRLEFESTFSSLSMIPPNGKAAIRSVFTATEGLFRLIFSNSPRLTAKEIDQNLVPILQRVTTGDAATTGATTKLIGSFKGWVDAAHFYRHEAGTEEASQPPLELAISLVSIGGTFIRWLAEIDENLKNGR